MDTSNPLSAEKIKEAQKIVSTLLYYSHAVDPTKAVALSSIVAWQANGTDDVLLACHQLLDYAVTHPNATICFLASNMVLAMHLDASYLSKFGGKSRAGGHYFSTNKHNASIMVLSSPCPPSSNIWWVQHLKPRWLCYSTIANKQCLYGSHWWKWGTPNPKPSSVHGLITKTTLPKATKSMDMHFNWLKCCHAQNQFIYQWKWGDKNLANYYTKHHLPSHDQWWHSILCDCTPLNSTGTNQVMLALLSCQHATFFFSFVYIC